MADKSAIEWTETTWNPVTGCTKVSPGCARCYIERTMPFRTNGRKFVKGTTGLILHEDRIEQPLRWRSPRLVFVNSLSDLFHEDIPDDFLVSCFVTMALAREHTFQVLTKRPERAARAIEIVGERLFRAIDRRLSQPGSGRLRARAYQGAWHRTEWPLPNVWLGTSIENARFTWRADVLREIPAAVRFISAEPLLGSLFENTGPRVSLDLAGIDWLIAGGESGPGYRPVRLEWLRELRDACAASDVAFFFKQWGGPRPKSRGRELDDRVHDAMPELYAASAR